MNAFKTYPQRWIFFLTFIAAFALGAYFDLRNNIHTVIPGQVYRSAQLNSYEFNKTIHDYKIKSIINLRGENPSFPSYKNEIAITQKNHIIHYDLRLNAYQLPKLADFRTLIHLLEISPKPILIHCLNGADRSGLAAAVALELNGVNSFEIIKQQFSIIYFVIRSQSVGKQVFGLYQKWLKQNHLTNNKENFLSWAYSSDPFRG